MEPTSPDRKTVDIVLAEPFLFIIFLVALRREIVHVGRLERLVHFFWLQLQRQLEVAFCGQCL